MLTGILEPLTVNVLVDDALPSHALKAANEVVLTVIDGL